MARKKKRLPKVKAVWRDASLTEGWQDWDKLTREIKEMKTPTGRELGDPCETIGYLVYRDKTGVMIAQTVGWGPDGEINQVAEVLSIPAHFLVGKLTKLR